LDRKKASDFPPEVLKLFDGYVHGAITRREFLDRAARFALVGTSAAVMLESLAPNYALAQQVAKDDGRIAAKYLTYPSPRGSGEIRGYLVHPKRDGKFPAILVVHENRGLTPYIEDVARRLALEGFVAFAPDALTPLGGYPGDEDKAREMFTKLDRPKMEQDFIAGAEYLRTRPENSGKTAVVGFCFGGGISNLVAARVSGLSAAVTFYGAVLKPEDAAKVTAPLLLHYAGLDERINAGWPAFEAALKANNVKYEMYMYPNVQHAFHNDATPRYDEPSAKLAWSRTIEFLKKHLA